MVVVGLVWLVLLTLRPSDTILLLVHLTTAAALYVYARPRTGRIVAFGIALVCLSLPVSGTTLPTPYLGVAFSAAAGAWALVILLGPAPIKWAPIAAVLLTIASLASGVGLAFLAAAVPVLLPGPRRRYLWTVVPALVIGTTRWLVLDGLDQVRPDAPYDSLSGSVAGMTQLVGEVIGLGMLAGLSIVILIALGVVGTIGFSSGLRLGLVAGGVGLVTQYCVLALNPSVFGMDVGAASVLLLPTSVFLAIALTSWLAHRMLDVPGRRLRLVAIESALVALAVAGNLGIGLGGPHLTP